MMKFIFFLLMLIPLSFKNMFWLTAWLFFFLVFMFFPFISQEMGNLSYFFGIDLLSYSLILLTLWIGVLMLISSEKILEENNYSSFFLFNFLVLMISLFITFSSTNLFVFYFFFEVSLIPTVILIMGWGYQPERLQAGIYLLFYTLLVSLPMMIVIFYCFYLMNTLFFNLMIDLENILFYFLMISVFLIKIPMFFIHLWLPKAHVEAPIAGSMILAGVMLKLGGYGLLRVLVIFISINMKINLFLIGLSLMGGVIVSLVCMRQSDMKLLIAYSSVSHMGLALSGILTLNYWGFTGALVMMLAHGLCSSGLFCLANISYERTHSRSIYLNKGMINILPSLSFWWFLLLASNMAAPPSLNLLGEIMLINSLLAVSSFNMIFLMLLSFFSACYSLYLYAYTQHGKFYSGLYSFSNCNFRENFILFLHWLPLNILVLKGDYFSLWI